jgi:uncharacterized glyoxalase superfamily protein PhnB
MAMTPYLYYEDVAGALKFLAKAFGFKRYGAQMRGADGKLKHVAMKLGDDVVMMGYPGAQYKNPKRLGQATQCLLIEVDDLDQHFGRAKKAGATILSEPQEPRFGQRRYGCTDPEGHEWYFAQQVRAPSRRKRQSRAA